AAPGIGSALLNRLSPLRRRHRGATSGKSAGAARKCATRTVAPAMRGVQLSIVLPRKFIPGKDNRGAPWRPVRRSRFVPSLHVRIGMLVRHQIQPDTVLEEGLEA